MRISRWSLMIVSAVLVLCASGAAANGSARSAAKTCSSKGLRFSYKSRGTKFSVTVRHLKVLAADCTVARDVARRVSRRLLHKRRVPAKIDGFRVRVESPCKACTPTFRVTARRPPSVITFNVLGGR